MKFKQNDNKLEEKPIKIELFDIGQFDSYEIRVGVICPKCRKGTFDYDGMLNLVCSNCGYTSGGCFT
jgi:ribosomal protein S27AE